MKYKFTRTLFTTTACIAIMSGTSIAQYKKINFASTYVSGSGITNGSGAVGFHPTFSGAFTGSAASLSATGSTVAYGQYSYGVSGVANDTIYVKINSNNRTSQFSIQPYLGNAVAGTGGTAKDLTLPSITSSSLSDGKLIYFIATAPFDGVKISLAGGGSFGVIPLTNSGEIWETFFKSASTLWPQDCDRPFESVHNVSGLTLGGFSNPYDFIDYGSNYLSTYSSMLYVGGSIAGVYTQEIYFPSQGSGSDEIKLQAGNPSSILAAIAAWGGTIGNSVTVQPYIDNTPSAAAESLDYIISLQFGPATTIVNLIDGDNVKPIYYKPGVPFNKVVVKWNVPFGVGTLNQFAFYDIRRVAETPKISTADSQAVCINTTGLQLNAASVTGEPNLTFQWYAKNPNGSIDSTPIATGNTFTIPDSYITTAGRKVFYVAAVRSVCGTVLSDADSTIVQVYAKPVFTNAALASSGAVGVAYPSTVIKTDSAATYSVSGLPEGLSFNASAATISGIPTTPGTYDVTVTATPKNGPGCPTTIIYHVTISPVSVTPVTVTNFIGALIKGTANLSWNTGVENNFNYFIIQRSTDGKSYSEIPNSKIDAKGNGSAYTFSVLQTEPDAYYRLVAVDKDGSKVTEDKVVYLSQKIATLEIYPNPTKDNLYITSPIAGKVIIYDAVGHTVITQDVQVGLNTIKVSTLSAGVYFGKLDNSQFKFIKK
ncbi:MAG: T9SS type A sorting domain-containing protein [Arachidicoccus sp.]|nr:T9SS type A sorting domain-containing protein [Arachidicoccus sp.]